MQKIKYISNRDLLIEIQRSKATFCAFSAPEFAQYDAIVTSLNDVTQMLLMTVQQAKNVRLTKIEGTPVSVSSDSLVFRVMTDGHIPLEQDEKRRRKSSSGEWVAKTNFSPFQHYVMRNGVLVEVGRSHWRGDLAIGCFSIVHGRISDRLATMFMLMVDRYSRSGSFRGYCVDEETQALTQRGWLGIDEISENDIILSYDNGKLKWSKIKSIYRGDYDGKMFKLTVAGMDALVTPGHKFVTANGLKEVEYLTEKDRLILTGDPVDDGDGRYSDEFVELVGWVVTEGNYYNGSPHYTRITIYQNEGDKADRIRSCLRKLGLRFSENHKIQYTGQTQVAFVLTKKICLELLEVAPNRVPSMQFLLSLTQDQRQLLIDTMVDGDGNRTKPYDSCPAYKGGYMRYCQKDIKHLNAFLVLCALAGYRATWRERDFVSYGTPTQCHTVNLYSKAYNRHRYAMVENVEFHGGKRNGRSHPGRGKAYHPNEPTVDYKGKVWCPETEYGSFMARKNGTMYLVGNSYIDEMRSHALVQLSQVGLQFDESRSENPFSFYTQIIKNAFRRILNLEKRNQDIRDDLLTMSGAQPSYTRQIDNEFDQRDEGQAPRSATSEANPGEKEVKRRGRKPKVLVE